MPRKYLTLMVIPHNSNRVREVNLTRPFLWCMASTIVLSLCALVFYSTGYYVKLHRETEFAHLNSENEVLRDQLTQIQSSLGNLRDHIDVLSETDRMMRTWASLSESGDDIRQAGVGGFSGESPLWRPEVSIETAGLITEAHMDLSQLVREARFLEASFSEIAQALQMDAALRDHTPSILPLPPDADFWPSSGFGYRNNPFTGRREFHYGLDIAGHMGTPIRATADGIVEKADREPEIGNVVKLDHGNGLHTVYGHLKEKPALKLGQKVKRGDTIGHLGRSGRTTAPHLHYAVSIGRKALNPMNFILSLRQK